MLIITYFPTYFVTYLYQMIHLLFEIHHLHNESGIIQHTSHSAPLIYETAPYTSEPVDFHGFCFDSTFKRHYLCFLNPHA